MKRKYADRPGWKRILQKRFYCTELDTPGFTGYAGLLWLDAVREPLWAPKSQPQVCIVDAGYTWLEHFPRGQHFMMTTMFDAQEKIVQWYIDICLRQGLTPEGIPWVDDLFLDIVVSSTKNAVLWDAHELENALQSGEITQPEYDLAWRESERLMLLITQDQFALFEQCEAHRRLLLQYESPTPNNLNG